MSLLPCCFWGSLSFQVSEDGGGGGGATKMRSLFCECLRFLDSVVRHSTLTPEVAPRVESPLLAAARLAQHGHGEGGGVLSEDGAGQQIPDQGGSTQVRKKEGCGLYQHNHTGSRETNVFEVQVAQITEVLLSKLS